MLAYTTLGVTDFERANAFYASLLGVIDAGHGQPVRGTTMWAGQFIWHSVPDYATPETRAAGQADIGSTGVTCVNDL